ncbi:stalk rot protein [Apiospora marii]|uniref:Stalk rot protein n=1 Tax=Apiospora marii TaxID=335849 RepID=A0ABR1R393_9PEZI
MGAGNGGNNMGGQDMGGQGPNGMHQPHATEYTLQGVMRFLQTEWHRHERDRNAWEIERQEMKGRIAALEGSARRADATQKALKRYVGILEKKVKEQSAQLKAAGSTTTEGEHAVKQPPKIDRASLIAEKLNPSDEKPKETIPGFEGMMGERAQEDEERDHLRAFLDQCQAEFTYLMITPANPMPPRESPPLPIMEDLREGEYGMPAGLHQMDVAFQNLRLNAQNQNQVKEQGQRSQPNMNHHAPPMQQAPNPAFPGPAKPAQDLHSAPMVRSGENASNLYPNEWPAPVGVAVTSREEAMPKQNHRRLIPETTSSQPPQTLSSTHRPDQDVFPAADNLPKSPNKGPTSHRRKTSLSRRKSSEHELSLTSLSQKPESGNFKLRYGLRGHLNTVRTVIFSGGGSPGEPEICTAGDDGLVKRFHIPRESSTHMNAAASDLDVTADFTHRGHAGAVLCLTSWSQSPNFSTGGRAQGDGWIFSGGQDASIRVWERGRVDPKATLDGHKDAVWAICVLPTTLGGVFGQTNAHGTPDRILLVSGAADASTYGSPRGWQWTCPG